MNRIMADLQTDDDAILGPSGHSFAPMLEPVQQSSKLSPTCSPSSMIEK